jgi:hypothetical protein
MVRSAGQQEDVRHNEPIIDFLIWGRIYLSIFFNFKFFLISAEILQFEPLAKEANLEATALTCKQFDDEMKSFTKRNSQNTQKQFFKVYAEPMISL